MMQTPVEDAYRDRFEIAAISGEAVGFTYKRMRSSAEGFSSGSQTILERRQIIPDAEAPLITTKAGHVLVVGHDIARDEWRSFRLDRIVRL
jgi:hypothetical protein